MNNEDTVMNKEIEMDLLGDVNLTRIISNKKKNLKETFTSTCLFHYNGGLFSADPNFISWINVLLEENETAIVLDISDVPVEITDISDFKKKALQAYHEATNLYFEEYNKLLKMRNKGAFFK